MVLIRYLLNILNLKQFKIASLNIIIVIISTSAAKLNGIHSVKIQLKIVKADYGNGNV